MALRPRAAAPTISSTRSPAPPSPGASAWARRSRFPPRLSAMPSACRWRSGRERSRVPGLAPLARGTRTLRRLALGLDELAVDQALRDLDGVERRPFAQIVGHAPQRK